MASAWVCACSEVLGRQALAHGVGHAARRQPHLAPGQLRLALIQGFPGGVQGGTALPEAGFVVLLPLGQVLPALVQLLPARRQLRLGVGQFLLGFLPALRQLPLPVRQLRGPVLLQAGVALRRQLLQHRLQPGGEGFGEGLVVLPVGVHALGALKPQIGHGVIVPGEGGLRQQHEARHGAVPQGGGAPVNGEIQGAVHIAHHGELLPRQGFGIPGPEPQHRAGDRLQGARQTGVQGALPRGLRQAALF